MRAGVLFFSLKDGSIAASQAIGRMAQSKKEGKSNSDQENDWKFDNETDRMPLTLPVFSETQAGSSKAKHVTEYDSAT